MRIGDRNHFSLPTNSSSDSSLLFQARLIYFQVYIAIQISDSRFKSCLVRCLYTNSIQARSSFGFWISDPFASIFHRIILSFTTDCAIDIYIVDNSIDVDLYYSVYFYLIVYFVCESRSKGNNNMAFSVIRNGVRVTRNIFEKQMVLCNLLNVGRKEFSINVMKTCRCSNPLLETASKFQTSHQILRDFSTKQAKPQGYAKYSSESESDTDLDEPGHRGESEFWRRKIRTFHNIIDINKDGVISFHDFELLIERFVALGNLSERDTEDFRELIKEWWIKRWGEITPYNLVTVEKYLEYMHHVLNDRKMVRRAHNFIPYIFRAIDKDQSGTISIEEYKLFFKCLGLPESDAILAFRAIDSNGDGKITIKEFVKHGRDFFVTEDENRISKYFWGPLVK